MSPMALEPIVLPSLPQRWRVESIEHPDAPLWLATAGDGDDELLLAVSLGERALLEAQARRAGAQLIVEPSSDAGSEPDSSSCPSRAATQLRAYLEGSRRDFELRLALDPQASAFEREAWLALCQIPFGEVRSYGEQAKMLGKPGAARAVGRANSRNRIPIVIPCHRIIGSDGGLTGFAGERGLLELKRWLLTHEQVALRPDRSGGGPRPAASPDQLALF